MEGWPIKSSLSSYIQSTSLVKFCILKTRVNAKKMVCPLSHPISQAWFWVSNFPGQILGCVQTIRLLYYFSSCKLFTPKLFGGFHRSSSDSNSLLLLRTLLSIIADFSSSVVCTESIFPLNSDSLCPFFRIVQRAPTWYAWYYYPHRVLQLFLYTLWQGPGIYRHFHFPLTLWSAGSAKSTNWQVR